jgi:putative addiction module component (TIGR02574 family)
MTVRALLDEARKLSPDEQGQLLDELMLLIDPTPFGVELTPAQARDLERRSEELRQGKAKLIPGDEAFAKLRRRE